MSVGTQMRTTHVVAVALAALLASAGVTAAASGNTPVEQTDDRGPPSDLPDPVPTFVEDVLGSIVDFLRGDLAGSLGEAVSDLTPGDRAPDR